MASNVRASAPSTQQHWRYTNARMNRQPIPRTILLYGVLGLIPFLAPPLLAAAIPAHSGFLALIALAYGALILSFLGGARWGLAVATPAPSFLTITLSMLPTIAALALLLYPGLARPMQLLVMAALLTLHFIWDARATGVPPWYWRLRAMLTLGAATGLVAMAWLVLHAQQMAHAMMV
jgi:hypothetical protein